MRLHKRDAFLWVNARCQPVKHHLINIFLKRFCALKCSEGVNINNTVDTIIFILKRNAIPDNSKIIANVLLACGPEARKDTFHRSLEAKV